MPISNDFSTPVSQLQQYINGLADSFMENCNAFKEKLDDAFEVVTRGFQKPNGIPHRDTQAFSFVEILEILTSTESRDVALANMIFNTRDRKNFIPEIKRELNTFNGDKLKYSYLLRDTNEIKILQKLLSKTKADGHTTVLESLSKRERKQVMNILHSTFIRDLVQLSEEQGTDIVGKVSVMGIANGMLAVLNPLVRSVNKMPPQVLDSIKDIENFVLEIGSWKSIASIGAESLFINADNVPRLLNAVKTISDLIYEYHGPAVFALAVVPLMLLTLFLIPATLCKQLVNAINDSVKEFERDRENGRNASSPVVSIGIFAGPAQNNPVVSNYHVVELQDDDLLDDELQDDVQNAPR